MTLIPNGSNLFVVDIEYIVPLDQVDPLIDAHMAFLDRHYAAKNFLVSGAKVPRSGGVIIAMSESKAALHRLLEEDPFSIHNVAFYTITEFRVGRAAAGLI